MSDPKADKNAEFILALKNANKHLDMLFSSLASKDAVLRSQADQISYVAKQCGDLHVNVYVGGNRQSVSLKSFLEASATSLNGARS